MSNLISATVAYFSKTRLNNESTKKPKTQNTNEFPADIQWCTAPKITMVTLITAFALYHGYKTWNLNKIKILHETQRKNKIIQKKLRRQQQLHYIKDQEIFICGYIRSSGIDLFIPMDILQTIISYCERRSFIHRFTSSNNLILQKFLNDRVICSPTYNFNGFKCDTKLYPNGIKKKARHAGFVQIGMRIISIPFNIQSVTVFYQFYDQQRSIQHHDVTVLTKDDVNSAFIWKINTRKLMNSSQKTFEYECNINVIQMHYYDGYKYEKEHMEIDRVTVYDFDLYEESKKLLIYFDSIKDNGQSRTYMMESINCNRFGRNENWSLRFVRSRLNERKMIVYLKLLAIPNGISKIVVDIELIRSVVSVRRNEQSFSYRNNKCYVFNQIIEDAEVESMKFNKLKITITKVYDDQYKLVNLNDCSKYGIIVSDY